MPTYDYRCDACEHEFELFQQMSAAVKRKCPACGKSKLKRLIGTGGGVLFKGGGFYETDYRSESYKKAAEKEQKASEGGEKKDASTTSDESKSKGENTTRSDTSSSEEASQPEKKSAGEKKKAQEN